MYDHVQNRLQGGGLVKGGLGGCNTQGKLANGRGFNGMISYPLIPVK